MHRVSYSYGRRRVLRLTSTRGSRWTTAKNRGQSSHSEQTSTTVPPHPADMEPPTRQQLKNLFIASAIPMVGFGMMDQTVMLQAGNAIDLTIGVTLGLSTLTAAAFGQICSDAAGVLFGGSLENLAKSMGLPRSGLTSAQRALPIVKRTKLLGSLVGVFCGCCLGLFNLFLIDTERPSTLKLQAMSEEQEFSFEVEASNVTRDDATVLTVRGPDIDGVLASMTSALAGLNLSLVELNAHRGAENTSKGHDIEDIFVVTRHGTEEKIPDDELDDVALTLLEATNAPVNTATFKVQLKDLQDKNIALQNRVQKLEKLIRERNIRVEKSVGAEE